MQAYSPQARLPDARFLGVEIDAAAVGVAREAVHRAGLSDRVEIIHSDLADLTPGQFQDVDLVFLFFMAMICGRVTDVLLLLTALG